ncbi:MAG: B12-binding domain-containing radical SAM protein [Treponema sp.]|nr:B12-binding domain-containing radical SAM protein [Treponema sp.]
MPDIVLAVINAKWIHPSLALRLLKANLGRLESSCKILEFALRQPLEEKVRPILAARPRLLGLSVSIWNHKATLELLDVLSKEWEENPQAAPKPIVVLGGPEVSWLPHDAEIFRHADYVIRGEGEEQFRALCYRLFLGIENPRPSLAADTSVIKTAYHLYTDEDVQRKLIYVEASRGCAFTCEFCQASIREHPTSGVREFPLEPFLADMGILIDRGVRTFKFLDRSFNLNIERAKKIMEFFLERINSATDTAKAPPLCVHFEMVPSRFPQALGDVLRRFPPGTLRLELGIQTFNPQTAALIRRAGNPEAEIQTLEFLRRETNAIIHADLIAGLPGEDLASFGAGFDRLWLALSAAPRESACGASFEIQPGILKCLPGTAIARHNLTHGMCYTPEPPYEVIETAALPAAELGRIKNFARFWEIIVNRDPFPDLLPRLLPPGQPAFERFMLFSDRLLEKFGRNWGIDRHELRACLADENCMTNVTF